MRWADALKLSRTGRAYRTSRDQAEPDMVLIDPKFPDPKAFQTYGTDQGWARRKLAMADTFDDWEPEDPKDIITRIGEIEPR